MTTDEFTAAALSVRIRRAEDEIRRLQQCVDGDREWLARLESA